MRRGKIGAFCLLQVDPSGFALRGGPCQILLCPADAAQLVVLLKSDQQIAGPYAVAGALGDVNHFAAGLGFDLDPARGSDLARRIDGKGQITPNDFLRLAFQGLEGKLPVRLQQEVPGHQRG